MGMKDKLSQILRQSRDDAGISQEQIAKKLGVSKKTVQNWEDGVSSPSQETALRWFKVIDAHPVYYYLNLVYDDLFSEVDRKTEKEVDKALTAVINEIPLEMKKKLLYLVSAKHGSSPAATLEMIIANLQTPLRDRLNIAYAIRLNYKIAESNGKILHPNDVQPNIDALDTAIKCGEESVMNGKESYMVFEP